MAFLAVGIGGAFGALLRFSLSEWMLVSNGFPYITLSINLVGSFLLAYLLLRQTILKSPLLKLGVTTGFLGGFTTFSTFSLEALTFLQQQMYGSALIYVGCSSIGCVLASYYGFRFAKRGEQR
ncbi:fluoride efflux transporter CrcB [Solibacillus sp. R5-41]|uniref:fluoride efflux transporter CrcB n=1 Tax=Solibacillus sp. R5-41 TaxID=2048654 RepID=UPI000C1275FE|nr:fluoride efflux transporter CrcB [Solibacillus sp. R5-41]ATP41136.1 fluoride efflux transporter CrcB [Solibacillus sp. R5-41]